MHFFEWKITLSISQTYYSCRVLLLNWNFRNQSINLWNLKVLENNQCVFLGIEICNHNHKIKLKRNRLCHIYLYTDFYNKNVGSYTVFLPCNLISNIVPWISFFTQLQSKWLGGGWWNKTWVRWMSTNCIRCLLKSYPVRLRSILVIYISIFL